MSFPDRDNPTHEYERRAWDVGPAFPPTGAFSRKQFSQGTLFRGGPRWTEHPEYMELSPEFEDDKVAKDPEYGTPDRAYTDVRREAARQHADRSRTIRSAAAEGVRIYMDSHTIPSMVEDGAYRSQHLTGTSNGSTDLPLREESEDNFGYDRPVYGSVGHSDAASDHYGESALYLRPSESHRVDVSDGDTMDRYVDTTRYGGWTHPASDSTEHNLAPLRHVRSSPHPLSMSVDLTHESPYIEAVIDTYGEGELPLSAFDQAVIPSKGIAVSNDRDEAADALEGAGINVFRSSYASQPSLPMFEKGDNGLIDWGRKVQPGTGKMVGGMSSNTPTKYLHNVIESNTDYKRRRARG